MGGSSSSSSGGRSGTRNAGDQMGPGSKIANGPGSNMGNPDPGAGNRSAGHTYSTPERVGWAQINNVGMFGDPTNPTDNAAMSSVARDAAFSAHQAGAPMGGMCAPGASSTGDRYGALSNRYDALGQFHDFCNSYEISVGKAQSEFAKAQEATAGVTELGLTCKVPV